MNEAKSEDETVLEPCGNSTDTHNYTTVVEMRRHTDETPPVNPAQGHSLCTYPVMACKQTWQTVGQVNDRYFEGPAPHMSINSVRLT